MTIPFEHKIDPKLDLVLERVIDVPLELVWRAWTEPEHLKVWFCPAPWSVTDCEIDLRPGGIFRTVMCSPEGEKFPNAGCYLEVVQNERLVWTDALLPGYRRAVEPFMTGMLLLKPDGAGTRYTAIALHRDESVRKQHEEMGFADGWGKALDQLIAHVENDATHRLNIARSPCPAYRCELGAAWHAVVEASFNLRNACFPGNSMHWPPVRLVSAGFKNT